MRLLRLDEGNNITFKEFIGEDVPPYGILSHTWGSADDEITLKDLVKGKAQAKRGYDKLRFCAARASADGLQWFWVDTCAIDKTSSAELSEAINSMYRWYQSSTKCYVYLSDVLFGQDHDKDKTEPELMESFGKSRWFTRGWTLQELLAPKAVEFYTGDGVQLGDKVALGSQIEKVTGITQAALYGNSLYEIPVEERLSWAKDRKTTREEDIAYCLLGIFDITMPLLYGEGKKKAMTRLHREIRDSLPDVQRDNLANHLQNLDLQVGMQCIAKVPRELMVPQDPLRSGQSEEQADGMLLQKPVLPLDNCPIVAACSAQKTIDVVVLGDDSTLKHLRLEIGTSSTGKWHSDGKWFSNPPLMVSSRRSQLEILAPTPYGQILYQVTQTGLLLKEHWESLGGEMCLPLTGASWGTTHLDIFGIDQNRRVIWKTLAHGRWLPSKDTWAADLGGAFSLPPCAIVTPNRHIHLFCVADYDARLSYKWWDGKNWIPNGVNWAVNAIRCMSPPVAVPVGRNKLCVFVRTATSVEFGIIKEGEWIEYLNWFDVVHPGDGTWISKPAAVVSKTGRVELFCVRSDNELYHKTYSPVENSWEPPDQWISLGGDFASAPTAVTSRNGQVHVFCKGYDEEIYYMELGSKKWTSLGYAG